MLRILYLLIFSLLVTTAAAQDFNYIQYTVTDGLPSNTVYDVKQDTDGYIWLATDAGLVRFDGRKFTTFTQSDGLPSNDVLMLYPDRSGRLWIAPMHNSVCYHYKGKIYNYKNDSLCSKMRFPSTPHFMEENDNGDMAFVSQYSDTLPSLYILKKNNQIFASKQAQSVFRNNIIGKSLENPDEFEIAYFDTSQQSANSYWVNSKGQWRRRISTSWDNTSSYMRLYKMKNGKLTLTDSVYVKSLQNRIFWKITQQNEVFLFEKAPYYYRACYPFMNSNTIFQTTINGVYLNDSITGNIFAHLLPGKVANRCFLDAEKNIWITTNSEGIWILPSMEIKNISFEDPKALILSLYKEGNRFLAGSTYGNLFELKSNKIVRHYNFDHYIQYAYNKDQSNRVHWIISTHDGLLMGFDDFILKQDQHTGRITFNKTDVNKSVSVAGKDSLLVATGRATLLLNSRTLQLLDTIWPYRSYSALKKGINYYVGTPGGLLKISPGLPVLPMSNIHPELQALVNRMYEDTDGSVWMITTGNGVIRLRNDSIIQKFNETNGLTSNNCKAMYLDDKFVWVGTEKGLNRIDRLNPSAPVLQYTVEDGLPSNDIHSILSDSGMIYIGTAGRLSYFDTTKLKKQPFCKLHLLSMEAGNLKLSPDSPQPLRYNENSLKFEYTCISFRSSRNITYYYRLKGQSNAWDSTHNTNLEFVALPPGNYTLEIFGKNRAGVNSNTISIPFLIKPPFWGTWWFRLLVAVILVAIVWRLVIRRIRQEQAKSDTQNRINELEQLALRSQMNPHFIFNCLNSIQNFLLQNNFEKTNEYLTSFAHLIRQTLDNSSRSSISIENEIRYLSSYLELENMRFAHSFLYDIEIDPAIDTDNTFIPTMILQPYVENSIRHGIRYRQDGTKTVKVVFRKRGNALVCIVEDNGIGRKKAAEMKSFMHVEYQSKGMTLTAERIAALNRRQDIPITVDVIDMEEDGKATGTQVIVRFPNVFL